VAVESTLRTERNTKARLTKEFLEEFKVKLSSVLHPGEHVKEYLEAFGWTQSELVRRSGLSYTTINGICKGKRPITITTAAIFERLLGRPAHFWLNLQKQSDDTAVE
jgi:addiction module HigA family antidote